MMNLNNRVLVAQIDHATKQGRTDDDRAAILMRIMRRDPVLLFDLLGNNAILNACRDAIASRSGDTGANENGHDDLGSIQSRRPGQCTSDGQRPNAGPAASQGPMRIDPQIKIAPVPAAARRPEAMAAAAKAVEFWSCDAVTEIGKTLGSCTRADIEKLAAMSNHKAYFYQRLIRDMPDSRHATIDKLYDDRQLAELQRGYNGPRGNQ